MAAKKQFHSLHITLSLYLSLYLPLLLYLPVQFIFHFHFFTREEAERLAAEERERAKRERRCPECGNKVG